MRGCGVEVIESKGCSKLFVGVSSPVPSLSNPMSTRLITLASPAHPESRAKMVAGPFTGLVICVTGLSKEARGQVMAATERLGGQYSPSLHQQCTHLVVQSFGGRKFEHAVKYGSRNGLLVVTLGWFVDSVRRKVRLSESLYGVASVEANGLPLEELNRLVGYTVAENSCLPVMDFSDNKSCSTAWQSHLQSPRKEFRNAEHVLSDAVIFVDPNISSELKNKIADAAAREGAQFLNNWFVGCRATHVICEGPSVQQYIGHATNLITPVWIMKTIKEKHLQRLVHLSSDLARQVSLLLEDVQNANGNLPVPITSNAKSLTYKTNRDGSVEQRNIIEMAKQGVRTRRSHRMQSCQRPLHPITPSSLLDSICWSVSEPTTSVRTFTESSGVEEASDLDSPVWCDAREDGRTSEASLENSRLLRESERREVIFKGSFLTILFPVDRFGELGPSAKTFFSNDGFTCLQVLDNIYNFYQENMSVDEIEVAIHTDSRHADRLRTLYASKESIDQGFVSCKRIDFLGSRKNFESLKRLGGENNFNVYELLIRA